MDIAASFNELERLDGLLRKTDAARYALPAIVQALSISSSSFNGSTASAENPLSGYRNAVSRATSSLNELGQATDAGSELIQRLLTRYAASQPSKALLKRSRYDPYRHRRVPTSPEDVAQGLVRADLPRNADQERFSTLADLERIVAKHEGITLERASPAEHPRIISLAVRQVARFHCLVTWSSSNIPTLQRVAASAFDEKKRAYEESDMAIWREIGRQLPKSLKSATSQDTVDMETLLTMLEKVAEDFGPACSDFRCARTLHPQTLLPPSCLTYCSSNSETDIVESQWRLFHTQCQPPG